MSSLLFSPVIHTLLQTTWMFYVVFEFHSQRIWYTVEKDLVCRSCFFAVHKHLVHLLSVSSLRRLISSLLFSPVIHMRLQNIFILRCIPSVFGIR